ncbi:Endonuclease/exonuclease/phosphatase [Cercophora newfieldiana]|uniref:Endonuclease/exonuclease/phosphatase n=1 Tax=Cercophora newfieldiana TaxID=92897 RepID=A0AA39YHU6_9PEZI|nr:Endonuclease/exonuclease/phosphatase [Cercophora newfieldiana]
MDPGEPPASDGPDGSSIKPVSSLRAKFENMNKAGDAPASSPNPRPVSPAPKPERLQNAAPVAAPREAPAIPKMRPKDKLNLAGLHPLGANTNGPDSPTRPGLSAISPRPIHPHPFLSVDNAAGGDRPGFLNTDSLVKQPSSPGSGPRAFRIPSRPHTPVPEPRTPVLEPRRSPMLTPSQPPSPPPPRRSTELRRERSLRDIKPAPLRSTGQKSRHQAQELRNRLNNHDKVSPFSSPPSSNGSPGTPEDDVPPELPTRPRPQVHMRQPPEMQMQGLGRAKTFHVGFEPPPLHHSVASKRRDLDNTNGVSKSPITPQLTGEHRPVLPARPPQSALEPIRAPPAAAVAPPRPPRPGVNTNVQDSPGTNNGSQKRVASTPTTQLPPPPSRSSHGRSMTVDRTSSRVPSAFRAPPTPIETRPADAFTAGPSRPEPSVAPAVAAYPDTSNTNRSKPYISKGVHEIATKYDSRVFAVCGEFGCTTGTFTRLWSLHDGELLMSLSMGEGQRGTSVVFKPGANVDEEGQRLWIGNNFGELMEVDLATQSIVASKPNSHGRHEIIKIHRHYNELWSLDEGGTLHVWGPDETGVPSLVSGPTQSFRVPKGHLFSLVVDDELWHSTGKEIRVFLPTLDGRAQFQVLIRPLVQDSAGDVAAGTLLASEPDKVFFGHTDGKISIYSKSNYSCLTVMNISGYKINSLAGVGQHLWAGFNTGKISVYDMSQTPWAVKKDWQAHENPVVKLIADPSSVYRFDRYQVVSLGADNMLRTWDALLQEDWLSWEMKSKDTSYCSLEKLKVLCLTWNAGASTPNSLRYSDGDASFFQNLLQGSDSPDILIFGFQELVDLEDKTATAKRFLKPKKKEGSDQERMSHQYRDWRDFLIRCLDDYMSGDLYQLLHTAPLVGLFTCIFVKADVRERISNLSSAEVKRGMGGLHGNKGAIVVRFMVDDTSLCFINCHLAAGQSGANQRHNDIAAILDASILPGERDPAVRVDSYVGGGDGTQILDHELCLLNGDLNYRIDTMSRDTVVTAVKSGNVAKLLERDQLLVARRRNPGFRLRAFDEMPITFAPTYKYDVGTDNYDTSEKKRSPAWCDRLLYRGSRGRIEQLDYRRHEVRVSDHRPVSGRFRFTVKRIDPKKRAVAWMQCQQRWEDRRVKEAAEVK